MMLKGVNTKVLATYANNFTDFVFNKGKQRVSETGFKDFFSLMC